MTGRWQELVALASRAEAEAEDGHSINLLEALASIEATLRAEWRDAVHEARSNGHSWSEIGEALGVTRQAANQRFAAAQKSDPRPPQVEQLPL